MNKQIEEMAKICCQMCKHEEVGMCFGVGKEGLSLGRCLVVRLTAEKLYNAGYRKLPENIGEFSDGYHTFNELYHHRAVLFSVICNMFPDRAWKSKLHDTGDMYDGMFIVGIETDRGQATYHYDVEPYWDMFKVKELEKAPKYDGHSPSDAIDRIGNLSTDGYRKQSDGCDFCKEGNEKCGTCVKFFDYHEDGGSDRCYTEYGNEKCAYYKPVHHCPNCGARMKGDKT